MGTQARLNKMDRLAMQVRQARLHMDNVTDDQLRQAGRYYRSALAELNACIAENTHFAECALNRRIGKDTEDSENEVFAKAALDRQAGQAELVTEDGGVEGTSEAGQSGWDKDVTRSTAVRIARMFGEVDPVVVKSIVWAAIEDYVTRGKCGI